MPGRKRLSTRALFYVALLLACALALGACSTEPPPPAESVSAVKLAVDTDGLYEVSAAALLEVGFDLAGTPRDALSLTVGGAPVAFEVTGSGRDAALRFEGLRLGPDAHTPRNVYWLRRDGAEQPASAAQPAPQPTATPAGPRISTLRLEQDLQYDTLAERSEDRWHWQNLFAPTTVEIPFELSGLAPGEGELRVYVIARSSAPVDPDHRLLFSINGTLVHDAAWDGPGPKLILADIPAGILKEGANTLTLNAPGDTGAPADLVQLHWIEVAHPRTGDAAKKPGPVAVIQPATSGSLPNWEGGADLVIVTVPQFREALKPLVEAREKQGLRVAVLDVEQVYDAFTYGRTDPRAIQMLMRHAREKWTAPAPRYLLLAGDASYDPLGNTKGVEADLVPTQDVRTNFSGWTGSDVWYALPNDGATTMPAFAVGRFPAQTAEQLAVMVRKTLAYEAEGGELGWRSRAVLVADNDEPAFAEETAEFARELTAKQSERITIEGDGANARDALKRAFADGAGLVGYFGHGSVTLWGKENVFDVEEAGKLRNERLPIVFTVTCLSGFFEHPSTVSLGETFLRQENGGSVAALVPSSAAVLPDQRLLAQGLAQALNDAAPRALGDIVLEAQQSLPQQEGGVREILLTFNLLGDPSMRVRR
jgi:hypothetical protein